MGAIASGGVVLLHDATIRSLHIPPSDVDEVSRQETVELHRREQLYRAGRPPVEVSGRDVIITDDGLATGATMRAALQAVRAQHPRSVTVAAPVGTPNSCRSLLSEADRVICLEQPKQFLAVGQFYRDFGQTTDQEVQELLAQANASDGTGSK
jgi:putative phosphoribosyl transferase